MITQSSGKQRVIDNADTGGQSALSSDANKLVLCTPLRPAQHAAAVVAAMSEAAFFAAQAEDSLEGGGEDWPDAYGHNLVAPGVGMPGLPDLHRAPVWPSFGRHQF